MIEQNLFADGLDALSSLDLSSLKKFANSPDTSAKSNQMLLANIKGICIQLAAGMSDNGETQRINKITIAVGNYNPDRLDEILKKVEIFSEIYSKHVNRAGSNNSTTPTKDLDRADDLQSRLDDVVAELQRRQSLDVFDHDSNDDQELEELEMRKHNLEVELENINNKTKMSSLRASDSSSSKLVMLAVKEIQCEINRQKDCVPQVKIRNK